MTTRPAEPVGAWDAFREDVRIDLEQDGDVGAGWRGRLLVISRIAFAPRLQALALLRLSQAAGRRAAPLGAIVKWLNHVLTGCDIAWKAEIGPGLRLNHPVGVVIGPNCRLGARCILLQGVTIGHGPGGSPDIGSDVFFAPGAVVYGAITVGDRARVGANAVVAISVPDDGFAVGVPARLVARPTTDR